MFTTYDENGGQIYTGSDIAKIVNNGDFNKNKAEEFFNKSYGVGVLNITLQRDGGFLEVTLQDSSIINMNNKFIIRGGSVTITKADGTVEKYSPRWRKSKINTSLSCGFSLRRK